MTNSEKIYVGLCILFSTLIILGNLMYQKFVMLQIPFHKFELSAGAILYPLTFLITDIITELYGKEKANFCIRLAIYMNILVTIIIIFISYLPATEWSKINDETFNKVFSYYSVAFLASIIACYIAQAIDVNLYLWIRKSTNGKYLWLRSNVSTCISLFIDTTIVISFMAAFSIFPVEQIWKLIINSYSWKLFFTICCTPLFYLSLFCIRYFIKFEEVKDLGSIFAKHKKNTKASFEEIRDKAWMESICTSERNICHSRESRNPGKKA